MHTIVVRNVPESHMRMLREEAASRNISVNDVLLEIIRNHAERVRNAQAQKNAA